MPPPLDVIPAQRQRLWGWPAVLNFALGGLGAGFYVVANLAAGFGRPPAVVLAGWLGPALVLAGFAAVAAEAGRPLRGARVLWRVRTSWMSRELWLGGAFALLAAADLAYPLAWHRAQAAVAALALLAAQGLVLRHARAVVPWSAPLMPLVFVASGLVSGAGLWLVVAGARGDRLTGWLAAALVALLAAALGVWMRYLGWSEEPAFAAPVAALADGPRARAIATGGYLAPMLLLAAGWATPGLGAAAPLAAGALALTAQVYAKALLILTVGELRPVTLAGITLGRRLG
jgi:DMSO reductase anchor subunit